MYNFFPGGGGGDSVLFLLYMLHGAGVLVGRMMLLFLYSFPSIGLL